jgi:hypothetical protein
MGIPTNGNFVVNRSGARLTVGKECSLRCVLQIQLVAKRFFNFQCPGMPRSALVAIAIGPKFIKLTSKQR